MRFIALITRLYNHRGTSSGVVGPRRGAKGSVLVEFAAAAPLVFILLALVLDGGFYMYRYLRVRHTTNQVAREMATTAAVQLMTERPMQCDPPQAPTNMADCCTVVKEYACQATTEIYNSTTDVLQRGITMAVDEIKPNPWGGIPVIKVRGNLTASCLICTLFGGSYQIQSSSVIGFEVEGYSPNCSFDQPGC